MGRLREGHSGHGDDPPGASRRDQRPRGRRRLCRPLRRGAVPDLAVRPPNRVHAHQGTVRRNDRRGGVCRALDRPASTGYTCDGCPRRAPTGSSRTTTCGSPATGATSPSAASRTWREPWPSSGWTGTAATFTKSTPVRHRRGGQRPLFSAPGMALRGPHGVLVLRPWRPGLRPSGTSPRAYDVHVTGGHWTWIHSLTDNGDSNRSAQRQPAVFSLDGRSIVFTDRPRHRRRGREHLHHAVERRTPSPDLHVARVRLPADLGCGPMSRPGSAQRGTPNRTCPFRMHS